MEEKPLHHAILKYRNLNDRKHSSQPTTNGMYNAAATTTPDAASSTVRKRQPFSYQDHTNVVGQLLGATSGARKSAMSSLSGLYQPPTTSTNGGLLRPPSSSSHHHHSNHHSSPSTTNEGFQYEEAFHRGKKHVEKRDYKRAVSEFSEAITISPNKLKAYIQRGDCYVNTGRFQPAIDDFSKVIQMTPANADIFAKRAKAFEKMNKFADAIADYTQAIDLSTSPIKVREMHLARGRVFMTMNSLAQALDDFTVAVELDPRSDVALFERAHVFADLKKFDLALHDLDKVIELESKSGHDVRQESWLSRAHMLLKLADEEEHTFVADAAAASTEAGFGATSNDPLSVFHVDRESALDVQHTSPNQSDAAKSYVHRAIKDVTNALETEPESVALLEMRGEGYLRVGDFHNALVDLNAALARDSKNASLLLLRAMVFKHQDAHLSMVPLARAINQVTRVIELSTNAHDAYFARARLHVENNAIDHAVEDLSAIVEMYSHALQRKDDAKVSATASPFVDGHDGAVQPFSLVGRQHHVPPTPTDIALRALLCRARLFMTWQGSAKGVGVKEAMADYQRILSVAPGNLDAQMELQVAKDVEEKSQADISAAAFEWLMKHGNGETNAAATTATKDQHGADGAKKASKKKKKKAPKKTGATPDTADGAPEPETPTDHLTVVVEPVAPSQPSIVNMKPPTPPSNRRLLSTNSQQQPPPALVCTRDEACESMSEAEVAPKSQRSAISPSVSSNLVFHFSLTENDDDDEAKTSPPLAAPAAVVASTPPTVITTPDVAPATAREAKPKPESSPSNANAGLDDAGSMDDEEPADFHGNRSATTPLSVSSSDILMDERYLKKRKKQLEKLRQDLVDACARRQMDQINDAIVRATRKQMHDQLVDEINTAKHLLEVLQNEPLPAEVVVEEAVEDEKPSRDVDDTAVPQEAKPSTAAETKVLAPAASPKSKSSAPTTPDKVKAKSSPSRTLPTTNNTSPGVAARIPKGDAKDADANSPHVQMLQAQLEAMQLQYTRCRMELERMQVQLKPALNYNLTVPFAHKLQGMERCMRPLNPTILGCPALRQVDAMISQAFGPTLESERVRAKLLRYLRFILDQSHCSFSCTPSGSYPLKTYLPDSDIDVCLEVPDAAAAATWHLAVTQALIGAATPDVRATPVPLAVDPTGLAVPPSSVVAPEIFNCTVRNVTFINAEVRVVKCTIDNVSIDFTANRFGALGALSLLNEMDVRVGQNHLFKRCLILIKSWAMYDSCRFILGPGRSNILGAVSGALSTFALNTMVMCIFNLYGKRIVHPLQGLMEFLHMFADFDWQYHAVSLFGPVPIASLNNPTTNSSAKTKDPMLIDEAFVAHLKGKVDQASSPDVKPPTTLPFQVRACNVVDPLNESNNVARSVTADNLAEMKQAFQGARQALVDIFYEGWQSAEYNSAANDDVNAEDILAHVERIDALFANGMQMYGSGWRPDLLVHPRQLWHGPPMLVGGGAGADDPPDVLQTEVPEIFR